MKNRKLLLIVSLVLALTMSLGGTLAYLQDTDEAVNVMTLGRVEIEQIEEQLAADGVTKEPFEQAKDFYPGTTLSKIVSVKNTGKSDAFFRTLIAFEEVPNSDTFSMGFPIDDLGPYRWSWGAPEAIINLNGSTYHVYQAVYMKPLKAGETSPASLTKVELGVTATNEDMAVLGDTYEILVLSQAVQTVNMGDDPIAALNTAFGVTADKAQEWFEGVYSRGGLPTTTVTTAAQLKAALENGGIIVVANDIVVEDTLKVPAGVKAELILNGNISQTKACTGNYSMIANNGTLTINGNGKLSFTDTGAGDPNFGWGSYTVRNEGTLVVEDGTIEHKGTQEFATHCTMAIYQYSGSTTINGGTISNPGYRSVRLWKGDMTINGGNFKGQVWVQACDNTADLTITGGSFAPSTGDSSSVFVTNDKYDVAFSVTGGHFETKIGCSDATKLAGCITGGTFTDDAKEKTNATLFAE